MIARFLYRNPRILFLVVALIGVAGLSSWYVMPQLEDPALGKRVAVISTPYPGADAIRVESLVTAPLEELFGDVAEIEEIRSTSRAGISNIVIELRDSVKDVTPVWSRVQDRVNEAAGDLPVGTLPPDFQLFDLKAFAAIVALKWTEGETPNLIVLRRIARRLANELARQPGTEKVDTFGDPGEEYVVEVDPGLLAASGLSTMLLARQIEDHNTRQPAGMVRGGAAELMLDVSAPPDTVDELGQVPIQLGPRGELVNLADLAAVRRQEARPLSRMALIDGRRAIVLGVFAADEARLDRWSQRLEETLAAFAEELPAEIEVETIFSQAEYVARRMRSLLGNLLLGTLAVAAVVLILMGWRSTLVITVSLPLSALAVLAGLRWLDVPIHQMSVTGLIIALGLLIDNAIVIVDDVRGRLRLGATPGRAITEGVRHLAMPLFGSTLTTTLAFVPIATLPGAPGEFVGTIAISVILAINASFLLAMTVVPALTAYLPGGTGAGLTLPRLAHAYRKSLDFVLARPWLGVILGGGLPLAGFGAWQQLPEQFFPPSDRHQVHLEVELPGWASAVETEQAVRGIRRFLSQYQQIARMHWFIGESAPTFFYNVVPRRKGTPFYAQALVDLNESVVVEPFVQSLQERLSREFPGVRILVRQLDQGPPFDAPIELELRGAELVQLQRLGSELRGLLAGTTHVVHTRSDLEETVPKLAVEIDDRQARWAGMSNQDVAQQLYTSLEGAPAGTLVEGGESLPVRVVISSQGELTLPQLAALELQGNRNRAPPGGNARGETSMREGSAPLGAVAELKLDSDVAAITRINGERVNDVKAYVAAGVLPSTVIAEFQRRLATSPFRLPPGYRLDFGGESAERDEAVRSLLANAVLLLGLMLLTLVVSFRSFRIALVIACVGGLAVGLGPASLWWFGYPFGFMAIVGTMGLVGVAVNDAIVVMAGIREDRRAAAGDRGAIREVVVGCTRHVLATTLTTIAGFLPLILGGGGFWPPLAIAIAGGVGGATLLALYFVPSMYLVLRPYVGIAEIAPLSDGN